MRIKVEVRNAILGNSVFWEGDAQNISQIRNIPARMCAQLVAQDGKPRHTGMWYVSVVDGDTEFSTHDARLRESDKMAQLPEPPQ